MTTLERTTRDAAPEATGFDWSLAAMLLGTVVCLYAAIGYAIYATLL